MIRVEGVTLPVLMEGLALGGETVAEPMRNARGHRLLDRRREKWALEFGLGPKTLEEAMMYRALLLGEGEFWSMTSSAYGSKGWLVTGSGAWNGISGGNPLVSNGTFSCSTTQTMVLKGSFHDQLAVYAYDSFATGATAIGWRYDVTLATYRVFGWSWRSNDTTATVKREALGTGAGVGSLGTPQAYTGSETFGVGSKNLTVTHPGSGGPWRYSAIRVLPWYLPATQVDTLITARNPLPRPFPDLPNIYATTDLLPVGNNYETTTNRESVLVGQGEVGSMPVVPSHFSGAFTKTALSMSARIIEV